jgi:hypothetical protein
MQIHQTPTTEPNPAFGGSWGVFWAGDRIAEWRKMIFPNPDHPDTGVEACFNLISLSASAHWHWNKGRFTLKPLEMSDDKKKLTVQFFWHPQYSHGNKDPVNLLKEPVSSRDSRWAKKEEMEYYLTRRQDGSPRDIQSGEVFTFTTDDPVIRPLPSLELLDMQWIFTTPDSNERWCRNARRRCIRR